MNNAIEKFREHVEDILERVGNDPMFEVGNKRDIVITNEALDKLTIWCFYNSLRDCLLSSETDEKKAVITDQFESISESLLYSPLNARERTDVIFYLIERNIVEGHILDHDKLAGLVKYDKFYKYGVTPDIVNKLFSSGKMEELLYMDDKFLDKKSLQMKSIVKKCIILLDKDNPFVKEHQNIKTHFLDQKEEYEEKDIDEVYKSLLALGTHRSLCDATREVLQKRLEKRQNQEIREKKPLKTCTTATTETRKKYLSEKEYKTLKKEASTYFNLHTAMPTRELTLGEVLYCATLLYQLGEEKEIIRALYDRSDYSKKMIAYAEENPIATYLTVYDQLKFYEKKLDFEDSITLLDSYFQETFLSEPEEYSVWKQSIGEELNPLLKKIPAGYQYEIKTKPQYEKDILKIKVRNTKKR